MITFTKTVTKAPLLEIRELSLSFSQSSHGGQEKKLSVLNNLHLTVGTGEIVAVVGASGAGKSLLAHAILGILPSNTSLTGSIFYAGEELTPKRQTKLRGTELAFIPQSVNFLDPLMRVGQQVRTAVREGDPATLQREVFARYHLAEHVERLYPFQISGGMARRVLVATALVSNAKLIIADEPTPGLDYVAVRETLTYFRELADEGRSVLLITHHLDSALQIADRIAVFYAGTTVEVARAEEFRGSGEALRHPYSKALWRALPQNDFQPIPGVNPSPSSLPRGCLFAPRCQLATAKCTHDVPAVRYLRGGMVRCLYAT